MLFSMVGRGGEGGKDVASNNVGDYQFYGAILLILRGFYLIASGVILKKKLRPLEQFLNSPNTWPKSF